MIRKSFWKIQHPFFKNKNSPESGYRIKYLKKIKVIYDKPAFWETYMQVRKQQLELDMEQQTGSK